VTLIGDAVIEARERTATGPLCATRPVTVFHFDQADVTITPGGAYGLVNVGRRKHLTARPPPAVTYTMTARIRPAGVDCTAPQVKDLRIGLTQNVKAGSVVGFTWSWTDSSGMPVDVGEGNQSIEARLCLDGNACEVFGPDVLNEDPGSSDIRRWEGTGWQFNWQTVDGNGDPIAAGRYLVTVTLLTNGATQSTTVRVRR